MSIIRVQHDGRRIIIPIAVLAPLPSSDLSSVETEALLDTGATTSGITPRLVARLGLQSLGKRPLGSAHGDGQAERYLFRIGLHPTSIDGTPQFPFLFDEVMGFGLKDSFSFGALIGMDILKQCDFHMDRKGVCSLEFG